MRRTLLVATNNPGKLREFRRLLRGADVELVAPSALGIHLDVAETGDTYGENARLKAVEFSRASGTLALADDSGIELTDLGNWPGVYSVRFAGPSADDAERRRLVLSRLEEIDSPTRRARFVCSIAIAEEAAVVAESIGVLEGRIAPAARGSGGFGYDPIFIPYCECRTLAELTQDEKDAISHRARAITQILPFLQSLRAD